MPATGHVIGHSVRETVEALQVIRNRFAERHTPTFERTRVAFGRYNGWSYGAPSRRPLDHGAVHSE